jgi:hypothetical protein
MSRDHQDDTPNSWMQHMRRGRFEEAWKITDEDLKARAGIPCWHLPRHLQYVWDGTSPDGKRVLVRCYHGLGDTIQFIRYAPLLKAVAAEVMVWAQPPLLPLLKTVEGIDRTLPLHDGTPDVAYDVDVEVMELPHLFRTTLSTIPSRFPYLQVELSSLLSGKKETAVGLVWKAGDWDARRSMLFSNLLPLVTVQGVCFYILQDNAKKAGWDETFGVYPGAFSLYDYARAIKGLDLLISIDSMPVHLAGALGVPVWNLLHAEADWRWMENRNDSPWYPTMRLFRQERAGDWESVVERVRAELIKISKP